MKKIIISLICLLSALYMSADDGLYISNFEVKPGETKTVSVVLNNTSAVSGFQFDLVLPDGITLTNAELSSARTSCTYSINQKTQVDGCVRFLVMPESYESVFDGSTGEVMTLTLAAADDAEGKVCIVLKNQTLTVVNDNLFDDYSAEATTTEVSIASAFLVGDVNGDGVINILDLNKLVNVLLEKEEPTEACDVNKDTKINILDLSYLVNMLLEK